MNHS
jgi:hypothetical protein